MVILSVLLGVLVLVLVGLSIVEAYNRVNDDKVFTLLALYFNDDNDNDESLFIDDSDDSDDDDGSLFIEDAENSRASVISSTITLDTILNIYTRTITINTTTTTTTQQLLKLKI